MIKHQSLLPPPPPFPIHFSHSQKGILVLDAYCTSSHGSRSKKEQIWGWDLFFSLVGKAVQKSKKITIIDFFKFIVDKILSFMSLNESTNSFPGHKKDQTRYSNFTFCFQCRKGKFQSAARTDGVDQKPARIGWYIVINVAAKKGRLLFSVKVESHFSQPQLLFCSPLFYWDGIFPLKAKGYSTPYSRSGISQIKKVSNQMTPTEHPLSRFMRFCL